MMNLYKLFQDDRAAMRDSLIPPEAYRATGAGAVETFKEASLRDAFPLEVLNLGPGALESRKVKLVDMAAAKHGRKGTGGAWDRVNYTLDDQPFYPIWENVEVPMREHEASKLGGLGLDLLRDSGRNAGELVVESENKLLVAGLGPITGFTAASGIQTFASAGAWTTKGVAWQDLIKARGKLRAKKVPTTSLALMVHPDDETNLLQVYDSTETAQIDKLMRIFPGGVHTSVDVTAGKAYVYQKSPTVMVARVSQNLTVVPLPKVEEDERLRVRVIPTLHVLRADGICEITSVDA